MFFFCNSDNLIFEAKFPSFSNNLTATQRVLILFLVLSSEKPLVSSFSILEITASIWLSYILFTEKVILLSAQRTANSNNSLRPTPLLADIGTTGTLRSFLNAAKFIISPFFSTTSIILNAITMDFCSSKSCVVRYKFLSKFVASTMFIIKSGVSSIKQFLVMTSSEEYGDNEYTPGKSSTFILTFLNFKNPSFFSTVTPGQFPTC